MDVNDLIDNCYYWVRWGDHWRIAQYSEDGQWWFCGSEVPKDTEDLDLHYIEGPIEGPDV